MLWTRLIGAAKEVKQLSYRGLTTDNTALTTYNFNGVDIGQASASRVVVVCIFGGAGSNRNISSVSIGGNAATLVVAQNGILNPAAMYRLAVPSGATADISVTFSGSMNRAGIAVYSLTGFSNFAVHNTASTNGTGATLSVTLNTPADGATIGFSAVFNAVVARTVSSTAGFGTTDQNSVFATNFRVFAASTFPTTSGTAVTHSVTYSGTNTGGGGFVVASFV